MKYDPDETNRLVDMSLDAGKPLIGSRDPDSKWRCSNPDCGGPWHGTGYRDCPGSHLYNSDGTRRDAE